MDAQKVNALASAALDCGAQDVESRINWMWAYKFPSLVAAQTFAIMLSNEGADVRGPSDFGDDSKGIAVGWRVS